ncbi:AbrB/MazE/SpoVT family DNA-binding domain-containing protein [Salinarchaeum sp. Harcht-Bsk1]|uniref:AbrB/MazE/SpoVT family DNA-binding domain-containing protein n=1 Tax=Salinarchaeum sp. Harcht-Bsk1 TaxID=1333523 RepID=UPI00191BCCD8|nr:AbrB/MazE/SpoVT family DNA-binding domain-containing protein [Salinarchaeum sp. Harcht-Bsk1]
MKQILFLARGLFHTRISLTVIMKITKRLVGRGKITIPAAIREEYGLEDGDFVEVDVAPVDEREENA